MRHHKILALASLRLAAANQYGPGQQAPGSENWIIRKASFEQPAPAPRKTAYAGFSSTATRSWRQPTWAPNVRQISAAWQKELFLQRYVPVATGTGRRALPIVHPPVRPPRSRPGW